MTTRLVYEYRHNRWTIARREDGRCVVECNGLPVALARSMAAACQVAEARTGTTWDKWATEYRCKWCDAWHAGDLCPACHARKDG